MTLGMFLKASILVSPAMNVAVILTPSECCEEFSTAVLNLLGGLAGVTGIINYLSLLGGEDGEMQCVPLRHHCGLE